MPTANCTTASKPTPGADPEAVGIAVRTYGRDRLAARLAADVERYRANIRNAARRAIAGQVEHFLPDLAVHVSGRRLAEDRLAAIGVPRTERPGSVAEEIRLALLEADPAKAPGELARLAEQAEGRVRRRLSEVREALERHRGRDAAADLDPGPGPLDGLERSLAALHELVAERRTLEDRLAAVQGDARRRGTVVGGAVAAVVKARGGRDALAVATAEAIVVRGLDSPQAVSTRVQLRAAVEEIGRRRDLIGELPHLDEQAAAAEARFNALTAEAVATATPRVAALIDAALAGDDAAREEWAALAEPSLAEALESCRFERLALPAILSTLGG